MFLSATILDRVIAMPLRRYSSVMNGRVLKKLRAALASMVERGRTRSMPTISLQYGRRWRKYSRSLGLKRKQRRNTSCRLAASRRRLKSRIPAPSVSGQGHLEMRVRIRIGSRVTRSASPIETVIVLERPPVRPQHGNQVHDLLPGTDELLEAGVLRSPLADDECLATTDDVGHRGSEQRADVRELVLEEALVGAGETSQLYLGVMDGELETSADQRLGDDDERAFPQIVRARLEAEAEETNFAVASLGYEIDRPLNLLRVAACDCLEHRQIEMRLPCAADQCTEVFGQTRPAEGQTGREIRVGNGPLRILAEEIHDLVTYVARRIR